MGQSSERIQEKEERQARVRLPRLLHISQRLVAPMVASTMGTVSVARPQSTPARKTRFGESSLCDGGRKYSTPHAKSVAIRPVGYTRPGYKYTDRVDAP
jgi:hypothetical protein